MQLVLVNLNCDTNKYKFDMSAITEEEWNKLAHEIVLTKGQHVKILELKGAKVVIRDNKAKMKVFFQDGLYHEHEYHLDVFGRESRQYADVVSEMFQGLMASYYGDSYRIALKEKLSMDNENIM